jgi:D-beta-D-heptose 7-phosphate kinase/D-beta-D-heptose 1-phosphate adenosyltransferase
VIETLQKIRGKRIIVAGDVMLDRYWWGSVSRISPEAPVPIVELERTSVVPGGAANVAVNLAGLGAAPVLFGVHGDDDDAGILRAVLQEHGVGNEFLLSCPDRKTIIKTRIVAHHQHVVRIDQESVLPVTADITRQVTGTFARQIDGADALILSDYAKGFLTAELIESFIAIALSRNVPVFVDPKGKDFATYRGATVITPNKREAYQAAGLDHDEDNVSHSGDELMRLLSPQALLITEGENGMTLFESDRSTHLDPVAQEVYDVTGAGDTVISVFAACVAAGASFLEAARIANRAAGFVVGHVGTTHITAQDLDAELRSAGLSDGIHA